MAKPRTQRGLILIIVLWFIAIVTVIIAVLASETRLSAKIVFHNKENLKAWAKTLEAFNIAQMELMMSRMPSSPTDKERQQWALEQKNWLYRFDGRPLNTAYPLPEGVTVRIYDHAGKINLRNINYQQMELLLIHRLGSSNEAQDKIRDLLDAWQDWIDNDDLKRLNGAEEKEYEDKDYKPRNDKLETVNELLLIRGFDEVFEDLDLEAAFTVHGGAVQINPNLASKETFLLIPSLDEDSMTEILTRRRDTYFRNNTASEYEEFLDVESFNEVRPWLNQSVSPFYTIVIETQMVDSAAAKTNNASLENMSDTAINAKTDDTAPTTQKVALNNKRAFSAVVQYQSANKPPKVLMITPYGQVPDYGYERLIEEKAKEQE